MHSTEPKPIRRTARIAVLALAGASLIAAGCGGKAAGSAVADIGATTTTASSDSQSSQGDGTSRIDGARAFSACMRKNGVPSFPDPTTNGGLTINKRQADSPNFRSAQTKCEKLMPHGEPPSPAEQAQMQAQALRYSACMRSHGLPKFPDPQFDGRGIKLALGRGVDPESPTFQAAQNACADKLPGLKGKGGPGGGNTKSGPGLSTGWAGKP